MTKLLDDKIHELPEVKFGLPTFDKGVLVDKDGHYLFVGFSDEEIKCAKDNPEYFKAWIEELKHKESPTN